MARKTGSVFGALTRGLIERETGYRPLSKAELKKLGLSPSSRRYVKEGVLVTKSTATRSRKSVEEEALRKSTATPKATLASKAELNVFERQGNRSRPFSLSDQAKAYIKSHPEEVKDLRTKSGAISIRKVQASKGFRDLRAELKTQSRKYDRTGNRTSGRRINEILYELYGEKRYSDVLAQRYLVA